MDIALICDRNYLIPTKTTIHSILTNKLPEERITVHIIGSGLEETDFDSMKKMEDAFFSIKVYLPSMEVESFQGAHSHVSKAALYKFYLPIILNDLDKVLYLDSDIIVMGSLGQLYNIDLKDKYAAVVKDMIAEIQMDLKNVLNVDVYFNSGVMLLNLSLFRRQNISDELWKERQRDCSMDFMDQNVFNKVFDRKITIVPLTYNYMLTLQEIPLEYVAAYYGLDECTLQEVRKKPVVLHLTDRKKPWNSVHARKADIWFQYILKEDFFPVLCNMCADMEERLQVKSTMFEQEHENYLFIKNSGRFELENVRPLERRILGMKSRIQEMLAAELRGNRRMVIYGAGQFGRGVYKCLWSMNLSQYVMGFAVSDTEKNVAELYGKKVLCVEECGRHKDDRVLIVGVKDETGTVAAEIKEKGILCKIIDLNDLFMDKYRGRLS